MNPAPDASQSAGWQRLALRLLAVLVTVLATILSSATASAATTGVAETRVRASSVVVEVPVGPPQHIAAGHRLGNDPAGVVDAVATGVAAQTVVPKTLPELVSEAHSSIGGVKNLKSFAQAAWGGGGPNAAASAKSLMGARTAAQLIEDGITLRNATAWRDVYQAAVNAGRGTASEGTAQARLDLMNSYIRLLGGGQ